MFTKDLSVSMLLDFYGDLLTEKQKQSLDYYYNEDMSLSEIAEHTGITRQGVRDCITRSTAVLYNFEEKLGLVDRFTKQNDKLQEIFDLTNSICDENIKGSFSLEIDKMANKIIENLTQIIK